jgi:acyl-CoA synthetase (AMP-forming)/AMP-acid ligase II
MNATTLTALMEANRGAARSLTYLEGEHETRSVTYGALYERALGILYRLQRLGARPGDKLILLLSGNEPFIDAFWAAVLGGIIPVPVAPGISDEHRHKLLRIARQLNGAFLYTEQRLLERVGNFALAHGESAVYEALRQRAFVLEELDELGRSGKLYRAQAQDIAFIQYSSGSTSAPKGIVLTHANLLANVRGASAVAGFNEADVSLSWMPLTHDMGLIGFHLVMFANRVHAHLMPTELFVRRPLLWLQWAARVRASILCSPNFGYRHFMKGLGERAVDGLDLSSVRLIFNGAEPISVELCDEFMTRLAPTGLKREAMYPVYGLAEASLAVSFPSPGAPYQARRFNRHQLSAGAQPVELPAGALDALALMSVGRAIPHCALRIVDDADQPLPEGRVGHIHIRGENVTPGYFEDPASNAASFTADGWLRTGDLGLVRAGDLYITGRAKEILFVNGQNYYPHDLERIAEQTPGLEPGKIAVVGVRAPGSSSADGGDSAPELVLVFVLHRGELSELLPLARELTRRIGEQSGLQVDAVVPVQRMPKTTSGKIQRYLLGADYLAGKFDAELAELERLGGARTLLSPVGSPIEEQLRNICESELDGRHIDVEQSLFDIGASSLKLIAIHERIDRLWPGLVDVTDIFEHPSVAALSAFIESKSAARP